MYSTGGLIPTTISSGGSPGAVIFQGATFIFVVFLLLFYSLSSSLTRVISGRHDQRCCVAGDFGLVSDRGCVNIKNFVINDQIEWESYA